MKDTILRLFMSAQSEYARRSTLGECLNHDRWGGVIQIFIYGGGNTKESILATLEEALKDMENRSWINACGGMSMHSDPDGLCFTLKEAIQMVEEAI